MTKEDALALVNETVERTIPSPESARYAVADLLVTKVEEARRDAERAAAEKFDARLEGIFKLIDSAKLNLESLKAFWHLQRHGRDALAVTNWKANEVTFADAARADLQKISDDFDERIPF